MGSGGAAVSRPGGAPGAALTAVPTGRTLATGPATAGTGVALAPGAAGPTDTADSAVTGDASGTD
nr:hypothetical protein [Mycobacterium gordonae]